MIFFFGVLGLVGFIVFLAGLGFGGMALLMTMIPDIPNDSVPLLIETGIVCFVISGIGFILMVIGFLKEHIHFKGKSRGSEDDVKENELFGFWLPFKSTLLENRVSGNQAFIRFKNYIKPSDYESKKAIIGIIQRAFQTGFTTIESIGKNCSSFVFSTKENFDNVTLQKKKIARIDHLQHLADVWGDNSDYAKRYKEEIKVLKSELPLPFQKYQKYIVLVEEVIESSQQTKIVDRYKTERKFTGVSHGNIRWVDENGNVVKTTHDGESIYQNVTKYDHSAKEVWEKKVNLITFVYKKTNEVVSGKDGSVAQIVDSSLKLIDSTYYNN